MRGRPLLPPIYFLAAVVLMVAVNLAFPVERLIPSPWRYLGTVPLLIGGLLNAWCSRLFERSGTTIKPFEESGTLVTEGPFRVSRNPMYLGLIVMLLGIAIILGSLTPVLVVPAFAWLLTSRFIVREEKALEARFGDAYREYRRRVRRWI